MQLTKEKATQLRIAIQEVNRERELISERVGALQRELDQTASRLTKLTGALGRAKQLLEIND